MSCENFESLFDTADITSKSLANELNNLRSEFAKFQSALVLNELRIELGYMVDEARQKLSNELGKAIDRISREISFLNDRIDTMKFKLDHSMSQQVRFNLVLFISKIFLLSIIFICYLLQANIDGSARHIMHAVHAQHLVQMGNRKDMTQMHCFPAYPMNPVS